MSHTYLQAKDWEAMNRRAYAAWFSALEGMRSAVLIGTNSAAGSTNLAIFNSLTHIGARPPLLGFVMRPLTVDRHTYDNIKSQRFYTINHMPVAHTDAAHQTSAKYDKEVSEFPAVGLSPKQDTQQRAPYVAEASVSMLLEFAEEHVIAANDTVFIVGAVREIRVPSVLAKAENIVDWEMQDGVVVSGLYNYYRVAKYKTLGYAKPNDQ